MSNRLRGSFRASAAALIGLGAISYASSASAACGDGAMRQPASFMNDRDAGSAGSLLLTSFQNPGDHAIVGMWSFTFVANGQTIDFGYVQWHSDGTELMDSGGRSPATENFCMGVWKQIAPSRYHLNHFALSYDNSGVLNAKVNIKEDVTLGANGATYSGPFTLDVYDPHTNALLQHVAGQVTAQRVPAN